VRRVTLPGPDGLPRPLVRSERTIYESTAAPPPETPPSWLRWYLMLGGIIGGAALLLAHGAREGRAARLALMALVGGWAVVAGLAGLVLAGLWGLTDHVAAYRNENLLQLNPLVLLVLPGIVGAMRRTGSARLASRAALLVAGLSVLGLLLKLLPWFDQVNGPVIALALPTQIGMAAALRRLG
jgi:hypothetical protein